MLWEASTGILFSGDTVCDGPLIASMKRILDLQVRIVHGGRFPSFDVTRYHTLIRAWLREKEAAP